MKANVRANFFSIKANVRANFFSIHTLIHLPASCIIINDIPKNAKTVDDCLQSQRD